MCCLLCSVSSEPYLVSRLQCCVQCLVFVLSVLGLIVLPAHSRERWLAQSSLPPTPTPTPPPALVETPLIHNILQRNGVGGRGEMGVKEIAAPPPPRPPLLSESRNITRIYQLHLKTSCGGGRGAFLLHSCS